MGSAAYRCQMRAPHSGLLAQRQVVFMGEMSAQTDEMVGVPPLWAVLAAEEHGTPLTTEAQAWRRRHVAAAEEEESRRPEDYWQEQVWARQTAPAA